jgi:hypothetical protein
MAEEPASIVVHEIRKVSGVDRGLSVCLQAASQDGEPVRVVFPYGVVATAVQALLTGDELARAERRRAGTSAPGDTGFALDIKGFNVAPTSRATHLGLGFQLKHGGVLGFALPREDALRLADLLRKLATSA